MPPPNNTEIIRTAGEVRIVLDDSGPSIKLETPTGTKIFMGAGDVTIKAAGGSIRIKGGVITIDAALIQLNAAMVTTRVLRCDTLIAESVVATSYTPGVGNLM